MPTNRWIHPRSPSHEEKLISVVNTETVPGKDITTLKGIIFGNTIRAKDVSRVIGAAFKGLVGGELQSYTNLLAETRQEAVDRMVDNAEQLGANAIVNSPNNGHGGGR